MKTDIILVSNLFVKQMHFEKIGDKMEGHAHKFDHPTLLGVGSLKITVNGKTSIFKAPSIIFINKGELHELEALEDNTVAYCIHPIRGERQEDIYGHGQVPAGISFPLNILVDNQARQEDTHFDHSN